MGELKRKLPHKCELELLVCEPHPLRPDRVTVGFVLRDNNPQEPRVIVRYAEKLDAVRCLNPEADLEALKGTLLEMKSVLSNVTDYNQFRQNFPSDLSVMLDVIAGNAVMTDDMEAEADRLAKQYLERPDLEKRDETRRASKVAGRMLIKKQMIADFKAHGVFKWLDKSVPIDEYSLKGDSLKIDFGYPNRNKTVYRMLDAVSLVSSLDRARILALSWPAIKDGKEQQSGMECQLCAVVENHAREQNEQAKDGWNWMEDRGIRVHPVSAMLALAAEARSAMEL